jgi:hypothetical protein
VETAQSNMHLQLWEEKRLAGKIDFVKKTIYAEKIVDAA